MINVTERLTKTADKPILEEDVSAPKHAKAT